MATTDTDLKEVIYNEMSRAKYEQLAENDLLEDTEFYLTDNVENVVAKQLISYRFSTDGNTIPLGLTLTTNDQVDYVNVDNTLLLSSNYSINAARNAIVLADSVTAGTRVEVSIYYGTNIALMGVPDVTDNKNYVRTNGQWIESYSKQEIDSIMNKVITALNEINKES